MPVQLLSISNSVLNCSTASSGQQEAVLSETATEGQGHPGLAHILKAPEDCHNFPGVTNIHQQMISQFPTLTANVTKIHTKFTFQQILEASIKIYREADVNRKCYFLYGEGDEEEEDMTFLAVSELPLHHWRTDALVRKPQ